MVKRLMSGQREQGSQAGFTLAELIISIALMSLILVGSMGLLSHMVIVSDDNGDRTMAALQAQYASFWIGEDVVQAQSITFGNSTGSGFPLILGWIDPSMPGVGNNTVTYAVGNMTDRLGRSLWQLERTYEVDGLNRGTSVVAEYLDPESTECLQKDEDPNVLVLEVTAKIDRREQSSTYETHPRAGNVTWQWGEL